MTQRQNGGGRIRRDNSPNFAEMTTEESQQHFAGLGDKRKSRKAVSLKKNIDFDDYERQALTVLAREMECLLYLSSGIKVPQGLSKLNRDDSLSLKEYLKLIKELKKLDVADESNYTDEELKSIANEKQDDTTEGTEDSTEEASSTE